MEIIQSNKTGFRQYLQQKGLSKETTEYYYREALNYIAWCDGQQVEVECSSKAEVMGYMNYLQQKGHQNKTRNIRLLVLKHFFDWQLNVEHRLDNPAKHIKIRGINHRILYPILSKQELESLYAHYTIPTETHKKAKCNWFSNYVLTKQRNKAILSLMIYQGLCTDEINRLTIKDLQLKEGTIYIAGTRKSNERTLELKPHQIMELMEYTLQVRQKIQQVTQNNTDLLFIPSTSAGKNKEINQEATDSIHIWKRLSEDMREINKKFINFKQVRTSVITHWLKQHNLRQVQYMAGHRYISSTEAYLVNQVEDLQSEIEKYHPIG